MVARDHAVSVRRLPIIFVIEASERLGGAIGVTLQQGLETVANTLASDPTTSRMAYMATIVFSQTVVASQRLTSVGKYIAPAWEPGGEAALGPALDQLATTLRMGIIHGDTFQPGDLPPLIFLALGSRASDDWRPHLAHAQALPAMRSASVFALIPNRGEIDEARRITPNLICLDSRTGGTVRHTSTPADLAAGVTAFFDWVTQVALTIADSWRLESGAFALPSLPPGLVTVA